MSDIDIQFYTQTSSAWNAMLLDIEHAKKSIDIEQYIFSLDTIGLQFLDLIRKKRREGIKVRMVCDAVGSWGFYQSPIPKLLRKEGIEIKFFNPIRPWRADIFTSNFFRDHRKILVIDESIGHVGGVGIMDDMVNWRDTHIRIVGPVVLDVIQSFQSLWENIGKNLFARMKRTPQYVKKYNIQTNSPLPGQRYIYQTLIETIQNAKRYIYLTTPYFVPDIKLFRVMRLAAKRGVDVRLIVPSKSEHAVVSYARESYFTPALKAGIKIYLYGPEMMHAKTVVVDDEWATAGSFNLDNLSALFNHEANISSVDKHFVNTLKEHFMQDIQKSKEIYYKEWIKRPLRWKIFELLTWPFHGIM